MNIEAILKKYDLNVNSSEAEIKEAYRIRAMMFHPDKVHGNPKLESFASEQMKKLNADFDVIKSWLANNRSTNGARYSSGNTRNEWKAELAERDKRIKLLVDKALVCFKTGRDSDGFIYLHEALALNPYDLLAIHVLGTSYKIRGMYNDAYKTYNSAFQYYYSNKQYYDAEKKPIL